MLYKNYGKVIVYDELKIQQKKFSIEVYILNFFIKVMYLYVVSVQLNEIVYYNVYI